MDTIQERGEALRRYFKSRGMTQKEAAGIIGITPPYMANILNGRDGMGQKKVGKICAAFPELSESYLLTGEGTLLGTGPGVQMSNVHHITNHGAGAGAIHVAGDAALRAENAQLRDQLEQARAEKDRLLGIIETLTKK